MKKFNYSFFLIFFSIILYTQTYTQTDIGLKGIGVKIGYVSPEDPVESTVGFGAVANLGQIISNIKFDA